ncbi:28312_t:CDS:2 [Racocetra persica]|uniref:28312_t:CDS:1 n=1 Tax=Racocetra persica TaxID=160502 RepID=A0ACA9LMH8_9GLOM|nr:28312_t:CDS:2 [Racocetra persica]
MRSIENASITEDITSLTELDEKVKLVNSKTGFPPFKEIPPIVKFNQETSQNGLDFDTYCETILKPLLEGRKFKPTFATQANYQELERRIKEEINPLLSSLCSQFSSLSNTNDLNALLDNYLSKIFQGLVYAEAIHDELGKQLGITNHKNYKLQHTSNHPEPGDNSEEDPNPHPSNNPVIKEFQQKAQEIKELLKPCEKLIKSIEEVKKTKEDLKSQLEEKRKRELNPDGTDNLTSIATKKQIAKVELEITKIENSGLFHEIETAKIYLANFARDIINFENESEFMKKDIVAR